MLESFALNGRVGDIGIKDKTIEVKLVFPNDERTQDELAFLFPIKKGLATVRILAAVNKGYVPGRRRSDRDETGTPLLPGVDVMSEVCHACGRTVDCVNEPFFAKPVDGGKEIILCDACYRVPQPETIETPPAMVGIVEEKTTCADCKSFTPPEGENIVGVCGVGEVGVVKPPEEIACEKYFPKAMLEPAPGSTPEQLEQAADKILEGVQPAPKVCATCGHPHGQPFAKESLGRTVKHFWKTTEGDRGVFEICPSCGAENQFPEEGGEG
jgi:hypothetical protein